MDNLKRYQNDELIIDKKIVSSPLSMSGIIMDYGEDVAKQIGHECVKHAKIT